MRSCKKKVSTIILTLSMLVTNFACAGVVATKGNGDLTQAYQSNQFDDRGVSNQAIRKNNLNLSATTIKTIEQKGNSRLIIKLDEKLNTRIESVMSQTSKAVGNQLEKVPVLSKYNFKQIKPLNQSLNQFKRQSKYSETAFTKSIKNKYPKRTRRSIEDAKVTQISNVYIIETGVTSKVDLDKIVASLKKEPGVLMVETEKRLCVQWTPDDPYLKSDDLHGLNQISASDAWDVSQGEGITVAVIDTGIDKTHADIDENIWTNSGEIPENGVDDDNNGFIDDTWGWDFANKDNDPTDDYGHGTHVAGTIAAEANNNYGIAGVAPKAKVMAVKGIGKDGTGDDSDLAEGIIYAVNNGADVLNLSFAGEGTSTVLEEAVNYAHSLGVVVVAAAGNDSLDIKHFFPASFGNVITAAASSRGDAVADFSNYGNKIDVCAPGVDILSLRASKTNMREPYNNDVNFSLADGTSMAAPHVAGLAALIISHNPEFSNEDIRQVIRSTAADDSQAQGFDYKHGFGRIDAFKAVSMKSFMNVKITSPGFYSPVTGKVPIVGNACGDGFTKYTLDYGKTNQPWEWHIIKESDTPIDKGLLGTFDATVIPDGTYTLRLRVFDNNSPQKVYEDRIELKVDYVTITSPEQAIVPCLSQQFKAGTKVPIYGKAAGPSTKNYKLEWAEWDLAGEKWSSTGFELSNQGVSGDSDSLLGIWDSSVFPGRSGYYIIRVTIENDGFTSEARTMIHIEKDLLSTNWPLRLGLRPANAALPAKGIDGKTDFVISFSHNANGQDAEFHRYSFDGQLKYSTSYSTGFESRAAVTDLGGLEGDEIAVVKDNHINIVKPDNSYIELPFTQPSEFSIWFNFSRITLEDVDGDGNKDIIGIGYNLGQDRNYLYAWKPDGTPLSNHFPIEVNDQDMFMYKPFLVVDLDNNGKKEFVVLDEDVPKMPAIKVFNWDGTPTALSFRPQNNNVSFKQLIATDLDKNGRVQIAFTVADDNASGGRAFRGYLLDHNLSLMPGWPVQFDAKSFVDIGGIADMDRDGKDEIIAVEQKSIHVLKADGRPMSDAWPYKDIHLMGCSIGDVDDDNYPEIVIAKDGYHYEYTVEPDIAAIGKKVSGDLESGLSRKMVDIEFFDFVDYYKPELMVIDRNANKVKSWTVMGVEGSQPMAQFAPVLGDFNDDKKVDISLTYYLRTPLAKGFSLVDDAALTVFSLDTPYNSENMDWPMDMHDTRNSSTKLSQNNHNNGITIKGYIKPDFVVSNPENKLSGFKVDIMGTAYTAATDQRGYFEINGVSKSTQPYTLKISKKNYLIREIPDITTEIQGKESILISTLDKPIDIWAGDMLIEGEQDGAINMKDIMNIALMFNSVRGDSRYHEEVDFNNDGAINMSDIIGVANHFGVTSLQYPIWKF